ncbi:hypothetical protein ACWGDT_24205 [Streptomyces avermitilis]
MGTEATAPPECEVLLRPAVRCGVSAANAAFAVVQRILDEPR